MTTKKDDGVVAAAGAAARTKGLGNAIELAMAEAVNQVARDSEKIWADKKLSDEEKNAQIAVLNDPATIRERMMAARAGVKASLAAQAEKDANASPTQ